MALPYTMYIRINISSWQFQPFWNILVKLDHFPKDRGENKKQLKPPPKYVYGRQITCVEIPNWWNPEKPASAFTSAASTSPRVFMAIQYMSELF